MKTACTRNMTEYPRCIISRGMKRSKKNGKKKVFTTPVLVELREPPGTGSN